jgi:hypothetical protein
MPAADAHELPMASTGLSDSKVCPLGLGSVPALSLWRLERALALR